MGFWELLLLAVGLSMDAFAVSICKGLAMDRVTLKKACIPGLWFGGFQGAMPLLGWLLGGQVGIGTVIAMLGIGILIDLNFHLLHLPYLQQVFLNQMQICSIYPLFLLILHLLYY